jgi:hypothetical protein
MMRRIQTLFVLLVGLGLPGAALAVPVVSIDTDPGAVGAQPASTVELGSTLEVDILIDDVTDLNGFQLTLAYDPLVLTALDVTDGGFLPDPVFVLDQTVGAMTVSFAEVSGFGLTSSGSGVLATLGFEASALGTSALDLIVSADPTRTLILTAPFGQPICGVPGAPACGLANGAISVVEAGPPPGAPVPEPTGAALFAAGALIVGLRVRRGR